MEKKKRTYAITVSTLCGLIFIVSAAVSVHYGHMVHRRINQELPFVCGALVFILFAVLFVNVLTRALRQHIASRRLGAGRAASIQFVLRLIGYVVILFMGLDLFHVSVGKILLGGALVGIILGVAAQQALGNFFASIILILAHPYSVGQRVILTSGALGGSYEGVIKDIGLIYTKLKDDNGTTVTLPNATILSGASIRNVKRPTP